MLDWAPCVHGVDCLHARVVRALRPSITVLTQSRGGQRVYRVNRRDTLVALIALGAVPGMVNAQPAPARLAWIGSGTAEGSAAALAGFRVGMSEVGLAEGKDYGLDLFWSDGMYERFPAMLEAALARKPAIILVSTIASVRAAQQATKTIPIVMISTNDPVAAGLVKSFARPGGNTTGMASMNDDRAPKLLEFFREAAPKARRIAVLINPLNPSNPIIFQSLQSAATKTGMVAEAFEADSPKRIDDAIAALSRQPPDALVTGFDFMLNDQRAKIVTLAIGHKIPVLAVSSVYADAGALITFGVSLKANYGRVAVFVKKILAGAKPADLPVEQPTTFEMVINLNTAKAIGIKIPRSLLSRADRVIE